LLTTVRQTTQRGRKIAGLFRDGKAAQALAMKRRDGTARLVGGDQDQVIGKIADLYLERRDRLLAEGARRGITIFVLTNEDAADISRAVRDRLKARGEVAGDEVIYPAVDLRGERYELPIAAGDCLRLFKRVWGEAAGRRALVGSNGDIVEVVGCGDRGLRLRGKQGFVGEVPWSRLKDRSGRLLLGYRYALTVDAAQGLTFDEHIDALPRGTDVPAVRKPRASPGPSMG
jgi:hypothetical protein